MHHDGGQTTVTVNQKFNGRRWVPLGTFDFSPGGDNKVVLSNLADGDVVADAVRFEQVARGGLKSVAADAVKFTTNNAEAASVYYVHPDHLGSPQKMTDASGAVVWSATYTPFGRPVAVTGPAVNDNRFPGQRLDQLTGLSENHWRDYDPTTGRYIQSDPVGLLGGINTYAYGVNNPLGYIDSDGLNALGLIRTVGVGLLRNRGTVALTLLQVIDQWTLFYMIADILDRLACGKEVHTYEYFLAAIGTTYYIRWIWRIWRRLRPFEMAGASAGGPWKAPHLGGGGGGGGSPLGGAGGGGGAGGLSAGRTGGDLPDDAIVCRGGLCTADRFVNGKGVTLDAEGKLQGVSVTSGEGATLDELTAGIGHPKIGHTTVGDIRRQGGDVIPDNPTNPNNPFHCTMCGITPGEAENLFKPNVVPNPNR